MGIAGELAYDGASPAVRASVLEGLAVLVQNPMAHGVLALLLPQLAPLLSDPSQRVRVALLDLLITVGCAPAASLWSGMLSMAKLMTCGGTLLKRGGETGLRWDECGGRSKQSSGSCGWGVMRRHVQCVQAD